MKYARRERTKNNGDNDIENRLNIQYTFIFIYVEELKHTFVMMIMKHCNKELKPVSRHTNIHTKRQYNWKETAKTTIAAFFFICAHYYM